MTQGDAIDRYHWTTAGQFLNAVALGQITPGPVVHTVVAVGYAAADPVAPFRAAPMSLSRRFDQIRVARSATPRFESGSSRMRSGAASATVGAERRHEMPPVASPIEAPSRLAVMRRALEPRTHRLIVYSVDFGSTSANYPFGRETFARREDAERFLEELRRDQPELASALWIEEHELEAAVDN
jgi:hypothetical protein